MDEDTGREDGGNTAHHANAPQCKFNVGLAIDGYTCGMEGEGHRVLCHHGYLLPFPGLMTLRTTQSSEEEYQVRGEGEG